MIATQQLNLYHGTKNPLVNCRNHHEGVTNDWLIQIHVEN